MGKLSNRSPGPPEKLTELHDCGPFDSGIPVLDEWLRRKALPNQVSGASRTYVVPTGTRVIGYYALAAGAVSQSVATGRVRRNMPDPVPVMVLGRLAIDREFQQRGLGRALLRDAIARTLKAADIVGIRALLVHAISEEAEAFYLNCGFRPSAVDSRTLMITLADAARTLPSNATDFK